MNAISNQVVKKTLGKTILDGIVLLMNITYGMSFLKVWFLDILGLPTYIDILLLTFCCYILRFGFVLRILPSKRAVLPKLLLLILFMDFIQNIFYKDGLIIGFARLVFLINTLFFMEYLYAIYLENKLSKEPLRKVTVYFEYYGFYNIIVVCLSAFFFLLGIISTTDNILPVTSLTNSNENFGGFYSFPAYLSIAQVSDEIRVLGAFGVPLLCGLSHEPHVLALLVGPAFFLLLYKCKDRINYILFIYLLLIIMLLAAASVTSALVFLVVVLADVLYKFFMGGVKVDLALFFLL